MSKKGKKDDAAELEPAQGAPEATLPAGAGEALQPLAGQDDQPAEAAGAAEGGEHDGDDPAGTQQSAQAGGDGGPGGADGDGGRAAAGADPSGPDAGAAADAIEGDQAEKPDHVHVPADYEVDAPFAAGDRIFMRGQPTAIGVVSEIYPNGMASVTWDDGEDSVQPFETIALCSDIAADDRALTAYAAAQAVFSPPEPGDFRIPEGVLECAAAFVRDNPDVEAAVIPVQLKLKGFRPDIPVPPRELAAWTVFRAALKALDTMQATEAAEAEAEARARAEGGTIAAPRDRLSFMPADAAMRPTGFTPSR